MEFTDLCAATRMFHGRHTADNVARYLCVVAKEFLPLEKISYVVHDEATNMEEIA